MVGEIKMKRIPIQDILFLIAVVLFMFILLIIPNLATANPYPCAMEFGTVCRTEGSLEVKYKSDTFEITAIDHRPANISYCMQTTMVCVNRVDNQVDFYEGHSVWVFNKPKIKVLK